ncbi:MAG TPA: hypothetical protein VFH73_21505 [Polyangia bacterium]|nr:hypothetical protein [Polyangia bacterium]
MPRRGALLLLVAVAVALAPAAARAADPGVADASPSPGPSSIELQLAAPPEDVSPPTLTEVDERLQRTESLVLNRQPALTWGGYIDIGFFAPTGDGAGYVQDFGHALYPQYAGRYGWVFLGDILSTAINSRGEVADLGDAPGVARYDGINSGGAPGFIANEVNLALRARISATSVATASLNVTPRTGSNFALGDMLDLDIAQVEWLPTVSQRTSVFAGKMDSVLGIEYRERKANRRFGITPSLIARYTTGPALGVKVRSKFGSNDWLVVAAALTNGSNTVEQFHFYDEIDVNAAKTASGRVSAGLPIAESANIELGLSGSYGGQDRSRFSDGIMWFVGPDLLAHFGAVDVKAQWLAGRAPGSALEDVYGLRLHGGGYLELDWMLNSSVGVMGRGEYRNAEVWLSDERLYLTKSWRATIGGRIVFNEHAVLKAELLHNGEYGGLPQIRNDVYTSSLVLSY